jgi:hypothetical protein
MTELDYERMGLAYYGPVRLQRLMVMMEHMRVLETYVAKRDASQGPLRFSLMVGQRVYDLFNVDFVAVSAAESPVQVYLDPERARTYNPYEMLFIGASTVDTFLTRIDFATRPSFDTVTYTRLRIEDVLRSLAQSAAQDFAMINALYQFHQIRTLLVKGHVVWQPILDTSYGFWEPRFVQ